MGKKGAAVFKSAAKLLLIMVTIGVTIFSSEVFPREVKSLDLQSKDISCASCALTVKKAVSKMTGVIKVDVSASTKKTQVEYDDNKVKDTTIIEKINSLGFKVERTNTN